MYMIDNILFILWDQSPEIWPGGPVPLRWYGLLFATGFFLGQTIITHIFKKEGKSEKDVDVLTYYMVGATIIGARLGHCLFYQPDYYLANPIEILKIWEGGLASHGATLGIIIAMWLYARKRPDQSWLWILDRIVIVVALGGSLIRLGNLMNSEIVGKPALLPWSVVFTHPAHQSLLDLEGERIESLHINSLSKDTVIQGQTYLPIQFQMVFKRDQMPGTSIAAFLSSTVPHAVAHSNGTEPHIFYNPGLAQAKEGFDEKGRQTLEFRAFGIPRHPAMVYESVSNFLLFLLLFLLWKRSKGNLPEGRLFSIFVVALFSLRFFYEFLKENQVEFESNLPLNMGQLLSIPLVMAGLILLLRTFQKKEHKKTV
jgi:phosphatidylglycerol:prolipoprotein diacylglycerol transferase